MGLNDEGFTLAGADIYDFGHTVSGRFRVVPGSYQCEPISRLYRLGPKGAWVLVSIGGTDFLL